MSRHTIHVTEEDIVNGTRGSCAHCPITLACTRYFEPYAWQFETTGAHLAGREPLSGDCWGPCQEFSAVLPGQVRAFINAFDREHLAPLRHAMRSFSFEIEV